MQELSRLASGLADSSSRIEDAFWENRLAAEIQRALRAGNDETLVTALDHLDNAHPEGHDELIYAIESAIECNVLTQTHDGKNAPYDVLLFAVPIVAWSRFSIPTGKLDTPLLNNLRVHLEAHVLAKEARLSLADCVFSPEQLPHGYHKMHALAAGLWAAAMAGEHRIVPITPLSIDEDDQPLSDSRYLLGAVAVPSGQPMFRWQEADGTKEAALGAWQAQASECLRGYFQGCAFELLLPDGFFSAWRMADRVGRAYALRASVDFLQSEAGIAARDLRAVIASFQDGWMQEYRVSFTRTDQNNVLFGVVWPLMEEEEEAQSAIKAQIESTLHACGVSNIVLLKGDFPLDFCDDCDAPLFADPEGKIVHAELPEAGDEIPRHLH